MRFAGRWTERRGRFHRIPAPLKRATVSVVVPCYRYGHYLPAVVAGIVAQAGVDTEVIVVDDASPDDSPEIVRHLAATYPNVEAVQHETNQGHIATYNDGLRRARGEYVVLLSADDLLADGALARAVGIMQRWPEVGLVYGFAPSFIDTPPPARRVLPHCTVWPGDAWLTRVARRGQNPVSTPTAVMRRELVDAVGGYDARLPHTADLLMWLRAAAKADVAYVTGVDQAYYRVHGANMHLTDFGEHASDLLERRSAFQVFAAERGSTGPAPATLRALDAEAGIARRRADPATSSVLGFWHSLTDRFDWRYWRRFGLRR